MKKLFTILLTLLGALTTWAYDFVQDGVYYAIITSSELAVVPAQLYYHSGYDVVKYAGDVIIPSSVLHEGVTYTVTSIEDYAFYHCDNLTSITLPNTIVSIGNYVFSSCTSLTSFSLPDNLSSIGTMAFMNCQSLTWLVIPSSLTHIGDGAFVNCGTLSSIQVEEANPIYDSRLDCQALIHTATHTLIKGCSNTLIPPSITAIASCAFSQLYDLTSIVIPNSVERIDYAAFTSCSSLTSVVLGSGLTTIGDYVFNDCSSLSTLTSYAFTPPSLGNNVFNNISPFECYVPCGTLLDYQSSDFAGSVATFIEECESSAYTRNVKVGQYGTLCLPFGSTNYVGATIYELAYTSSDRSALYLDEVTTIEAGVPYIFHAHADCIQVHPDEHTAAFPSFYNGLYGTFEDILPESNFLRDKYILYNNAVCLCGDGCGLYAYRAYIQLDEVSIVSFAPLPGRKRVCMSLQDTNETTDLYGIITDTHSTMHTGIYDLFGRQINNPTVPGVYLINGQKVLITQ